MIRLSDLLGQDAVALGSAKRTGSVKGVVIAGRRITAVELSDGTISSDSVRSFEGDVLTYDERSVIKHGDRSASDPRKMRVLDMNGDEVGTIADLQITADGSIDSLILTDGSSVPGTRLRIIGSYAAILDVDLPAPSGPRLG